MLGLTYGTDTMLRAGWLRSVSRVGMVCGVFAMLLVSTGCPPPPPACTEDADCTDDTFCNGAETCDPDNEAADNAGCVDGTAPCAADEVCDETNDECDECDADADCDDGDFCNGAETCGADGACVAGTDPCADGEVCDEDSDACVECLADADCADDGLFCTGAESCDTDTNTCVSSGDPCEEGEQCDDDLDDCLTVCVNAADCDDSDACTTDACDNGVCSNTAIDVDNGDFCDGDETCDPATGDVTSSGDPCAEGTTCNEDTDACETDVSCTTDEDCDDGLFCTGTETCSIAEGETEGVCADGTEPCETDQTCNETTDACENPDGTAFRLTPLKDTFTGTSGDDSFDGTRALESGNLLVTANNTDQLTGGLGTDTLDADITANTTINLLTGIEVFNVSIVTAGDFTFNMSGADAPTTINNNNPLGNLTVNNVRAVLTDVGMSNGTDDFTVTIDSTTLTGTTDALTLTLEGVTDAGAEPVITVQPSSAGSGYETINVMSSGSVANSIQELTDGNGNSFATLNIEGDQNLTFGAALATTVTTVNATNATGKVDVTLGNAAVTVTGGSGNDTFRFGGNFDTNDSVTGGSGTDILESTDEDFTGTSAVQTKVSGVETIKATDQLVGNLNVVHWGATNATIAGKDGTARTVTIPTGGTIEVTADVGANDLDVVLSGTDTTADTFTLKINGTDAGSGADFTGNVDAAGFEFLNLNSTGTGDTGDDSDNDLAAITLNAVGGVTETITITGATNLDIGGAITADLIDASAFTGAFNNADGTVTSAIGITTGSGNDSIDGSTGGDAINAGAGNDTIEGKGGADQLTGGTGNDTFNFDNGNTDETVIDTITDFEAGTSSSTVDILLFDITSIEAVTGVTDLVDTSANSVAATNGTFVQLGSDAQTVANADMVGLIGDYTNAANALANKTSWTITYGAALTDDDAYLVAYTSGNDVRIAVAVDNGGGATSDAIDTLFDIAILRNTSLSNLDSGDINTQ